MALIPTIDPALSAEPYPNKPIRMVTASLGGGGDIAARLIAQGISTPLGQQVIVDNRPGVIAGPLVAKASPDGYTLLVAGNNMWLAPFLRDNVPYDPVRDFLPIALANRTPSILLVHPSLGVSSVSDLIRLAKGKPGELNYSSGGAGSTPHLTAELFKSMAGLNVVRIPYKGAAPALTALMSGEVQLTFASAGAVTAQLKSGKLRALAVTSAEPSALAPGLPTMTASGLPGFEATQKNGIFAPARTPAAIINRLNREIAQLLATSEAKERSLAAGVETVGGAPELLAREMKGEMARLGKMIKDAGIRDE